MASFNKVLKSKKIFGVFGNLVLSLRWYPSHELVVLWISSAQLIILWSLWNQLKPMFFKVVQKLAHLFWVGSCGTNITPSLCHLSWRKKHKVRAKPYNISLSFRCWISVVGSLFDDTMFFCLLPYSFIKMLKAPCYFDVIVYLFYRVYLRIFIIAFETFNPNFKFIFN